MARVQLAPRRSTHHPHLLTVLLGEGGTSFVRGDAHLELKHLASKLRCWLLGDAEKHSWLLLSWMLVVLRTTRKLILALPLPLQREKPLIPASSVSGNPGFRAHALDIPLVSPDSQLPILTAK